MERVHEIIYNPFRGVSEPIEEVHYSKLKFHATGLELIESYDFLDQEQIPRQVRRVEFVPFGFSFGKTTMQYSDAQTEEEKDTHYVVDLFTHGHMVSIHTTKEDADKIYKAIKIWMLKSKN